MFWSPKLGQSLPRNNTNQTATRLFEVFKIYTSPSMDANNLKYLEAKSLSSIFWKYFLPRATCAATKSHVRNESNQKKKCNKTSIGNIDVKVNPRLSHFRSPDKIALVQYESTQRKMQKSQKAWNWLGMLTRKWNINYPTFNHLHSHSLKATWIRWEKKEIQNLIDLKCWNIDYPTFDLRLDQADKTAFFLSGTRSSINVYQQTSHRAQPGVQMIL